MAYTTIRQFVTPRFRVIVDAAEDYDLDLSWDDDGSTAKALAAGRLIAFAVRARVLHRASGAELASDYLGGCIYESFDAFMDHRECGRQNRQYAAEGKTGRCGSYFADMIANVIAEARLVIADLQQKGN